MSGPYDSRDNGHSFAGLYGLGNPIVTWLIGRGQGELVALTPEELQHQPPAPRCTRRDCKEPMRWRGNEWVCYQHERPVRLKIPPALQKIPPPPFSTFDVIGKEVDVVYTREGSERHASWKYIVRELTS